MARLKAIGLAEANYSPQSQVKVQRQHDEAAQAMQESTSSNTATTFKIFKLSDTKKNGKYHMEGIDDVWNPAKGRMERIRLLRGYPSIWVEDQKGLEKTFLTYDEINSSIPEEAIENSDNLGSLDILSPKIQSKYSRCFILSILFASYLKNSPPQILASSPYPVPSKTTPNTLSSNKLCSPKIAEK